jgi:DNA-binding CsgD family transcriptional regulator
MQEFEHKTIAELTGRVYEAALDPDRWTEFVALIERFYPDARVTLFGHDRGCPTATLAARVNYLEDDLSAYRDEFVRCSPFIAAAPKVPLGRPFLYEELVNDREFERTDYYNEYVRPRRLGRYATGLMIDRDGPVGTHPKRATVLSIVDHREDSDRRARQLRLLELLEPHLKRSLQLHRTMVAEKLKADAARLAFDHWAHAALVLNACGEVVGLNRSGDALLKRCDGLWLGRGGRLYAADESTTRALHAAMMKCAALAAGKVDQRSADVDAVTLPRQSGNPPLRLMMWPLAAVTGQSLPGHARAAVLTIVFDQVHRTPAGWIARQFRLTPSEERLAECIINGASLDEAAAQIGIRLSTARTRLKTIQQKTDCRRQSDLVRLAYSMPPLRRD